jgi:uncharacterized repeat protein (TIGR03803 family)
MRPGVVYKSLYSFDGKDGGAPYAGLLNVNGTLYGTTYAGGVNCESSSFATGCGTVFKITPSGKEALLYSFKGGYKDGETPHADLINVNGTLHGTTVYGGANCTSSGACGTVFSITPSGKEALLYSFDGKDGEYPYAGLINVKGKLYGTTYRGGANGYGTVFSITPSGKGRVLHSFGSGDGVGPYAGLLNVNGTLYGTTYHGGTHGSGTVFSITTSGKETVLYSFKGGSGDGASPAAGLLNVNGTLYGTTSNGGSGSCLLSSYALGCGTVFSITTSGKETVLHSFKGGTGDGRYPEAGLINVNGTLYGTTSSGGANRDGTVFNISP